MICPKCGKEVDDGNVFCKFCGASLDGADNLNEEQKKLDTEENEVQQEQENAEEAVKEEIVNEPKKEESKKNEGFVINTGAPKKEVKKEAKAKVKEENNKEKNNESQNENESIVDDTTNTTTQEKKIVINGKEQTVKPRKRHSIITIGIILAVVIVIVAIILISMSLMSTPEKLYKKLFSSVSNSFDNALEFNSANVSINADMSTDIEELKESVDGLNLGLNVQYDKEIEEYIAKVDVQKGQDPYLNLTAMINLLDKKLYIGESNLYDKLICIDIPEDQINNIRVALSEQSNNLNTNDLKNITKIVTDTVNNELKAEMFTSEKITVNIDGKDKKVKDNILAITYDELVELVNNVAENLKSNEEFMSYFEDKTSIEQSLDSFVNDVEMMDEYDYQLHIYTSGLFNSVVGFAFVQTDNILEESYVLEFLKQNNVSGTITYDIVSGADRARVLSADIVINEANNNKVDMDISMDLRDQGNLTLNLEVLSDYNNGIEALDVSNSININDMTDEDLQQILGSLMTTPLFGNLAQIGETEISGTISGGDNYLTTFSDRKVYVNVPSTFEEIYNGNYIKSYTKDTDLGYCDVELNTDSYTEEEFLDYLNDKLDYYKESGDYIDVTISEPETLNVGEREYKKVTLRYTYSASNGSFIMPYQSDYYYTLIEDDEVYYVEVSDEDGIITQDELNTFLTIEVE